MSFPDNIKKTVWYVESRESQQADEQPKMGSAVSVWLKRTVDGKEVRRRYLLTCSHVVRCGQKADGRIRNNILCWQHGTGYLQFKDGRKWPDQERDGIWTAKVCFDAYERSLDSLNEGDLRPERDWVLLEVAEEDFQSYEPVMDWRDVDENGTHTIIGYPGGSANWHDSYVIDSHDEDQFRVKLSNHPGILKLGGKGETGPGMSGGGVFDAEGCLVGIHRSQNRIDLSYGSIAARFIFDELNSRGFQFIARPAMRKNSSRNAKPTIPPLLPHLVDRTLQINAVSSALANRRMIRQPLIFLVYGDDAQAPDMLLKRIEETVLKPGARFYLPWPEMLNGISQLPYELLKNLSDAVQDENAASELDSVDAINRSLKQRPTMLETTVHDDQWIKYGPQCVEVFLQFWNNWPDLAPSQQLFVFFIIKYSSEGGTATGFASRLLSALFGDSKKTSQASIENALNQLTQKEWDKLQVFKLPKLTGVKRLDAETWAKQKVDKVLNGINKDKLVSRIGKLFREFKLKNLPDDIPMELLADSLEELLQDTTLYEG